MNTHDPYLAQVERFGKHLLENHLPEGLCYHNLRHTIEVVEAALEIGLKMKLTDVELECVQIAAWLHDVGHSLTYQNHEAASHLLAQGILKAIDYPEEYIKKVLGCIGATRMPQRPKNLLEEIVCDADMAHLSRENFFDRNKLLRQEWNILLDKTYTDKEWHKDTIQFLSNHQYFTTYAREIWEKRKQFNLSKINMKIQSRNMELPKNSEATFYSLPFQRNSLCG